MRGTAERLLFPGERGRITGKERKWQRLEWMIEKLLIRHPGGCRRRIPDTDRNPAAEKQSAVFINW